MPVSNRELQLSNDLMTLQKAYNSAVKKNIQLRIELSEMEVASQKNKLMYESEISRLQSIVDRANGLEAISTTSRKRKKQALGGAVS